MLGDIRDVLTSSLDLHAVLREAYPLLVDLLSADYAALGVTEPRSPAEFEWIVADGQEAFFAEYDEMASHDFVRRSVAGKPKRVLRDSDMTTRRELEANVMYHRARELGMPLEHVMGVMLHSDQAWSSGLAVYREKRRPFSERERLLLQTLTPAFEHAVRNCRAFGDAEHKALLLESLLVDEGVAVVVVTPFARELFRTRRATALLKKWFSSDDNGTLPQVLLAALQTWNESPCGEAPPVLCRADAEASLFARPRWFSQGGQPLVALVLEERTEVPRAWRARLTRRQREATARTIRGWDNQLIADDLGCTLLTLKVHLKSVFKKLGVDSRAQLIALAHEEFKRDST